MLKNKKQIYFILGSGGHTKQMLILENKFDKEKYNKFFICAKNDNISHQKILSISSKKAILINRSRETGESIVSALVRNILLLGIFKEIIQSYRIAKQMNKAIVVTAGPSTGFFIFVFAKLKGNFCVYLESWSRVKKLSLSGKLYNTFANLFFVQWEEQLKNDKSLIYKGRLL